MKITRADLEPILRDKTVLQRILSDLTSHWDVQKALAEDLADGLSDRLAHYHQVASLLRDEQTLLTMVQRLAVGEREPIAPAPEAAPLAGRTTRQLAHTKQQLQLVKRRLHQTERRLLHSDRLAALGELASGVIHEINNPLGTIRSLVQLLEESTNIHQTQQRDLKTIESEITRIQTIVDKLRSFVRPSTVTLRSIGVRELIEETLSLLHHQLAQSHVRLVTTYEPGLPLIKADHNQLKQVLINLILNAVQAMPHGGQLTVSARRAAEWLLIDVTDVGCGIPRAHLAKLFQPFFTTRKGGLGLGLAISHEIVTRHRGRIEVTSQVGKGSIFTIHLPLARPSRQRATRSASHVQAE